VSVWSRISRLFALAGLAGASAAIACPSGAAEPKAATANANANAGPIASTAPAAPSSGRAKRALPDYDGRGNPESHAHDGAVWVPRTVLFPLWAISEYGIRRPLGWLVTTAEKNNWATALIDFFTFDDHKAGVVPTTLIDFGFEPSVGLYAFWNEAFAKRNAIRIGAATWGEHWLSLNVADRVIVGPRGGTLDFRVALLRRPDYRFYALGPDSTTFNARYGADSADFGVRYQLPGWRSSLFHAAAGVRRWVLRTDITCCDEPSLPAAIASGAIAPPDGSAYTVGYSRLDATIDSRRKGREGGSGILVRGFGEHAAELSTEHRSWLAWGADAGVSFDVNGHERIISLVGALRFTESLTGTLPFNELATLGGVELMRGFFPGRLRDRSASVLTLQYTWPVWVFLDGVTHVAVGNVFGEHLRGWEADKLRWSAGLGVRTSSERDHAFEAFIALGSSTFQQGGGVENVRLVVGTHYGF
jgi:hypothetical protein